MHFCQDELNVLLGGLPFIEPIVRYARSLARCALWKLFHSSKKSTCCLPTSMAPPRCQHDDPPPPSCQHAAATPPSCQHAAATPPSCQLPSTAPPHRPPREDT